MLSIQYTLFQKSRRDRKIQFIGNLATKTKLHIIFIRQCKCQCKFQCINLHSCQTKELTICNFVNQTDLEMSKLKTES